MWACNEDQTDSSSNLSKEGVRPPQPYHSSSTPSLRYRRQLLHGHGAGLEEHRVGGVSGCPIPGTTSDFSDRQHGHPPRPWESCEPALQCGRRNYLGCCGQPSYRWHGRPLRDSVSVVATTACCLSGPSTTEGCNTNTNTNASSSSMLATHF